MNKLSSAEVLITIAGCKAENTNYYRFIRWTSATHEFGYGLSYI